MADQRHYKVRLFEGLMYLSIATTFAASIYLWATIGAAPGPNQDELHFIVSALEIVSTATAIVMGFLVWLAARRRKNWARWVLLVVVFWGLIYLPRSILHHPEAYLKSFGNFKAAGDEKIQIVWMVLQGAYVVRVIALFLIFTGDARAWFRKSAPVISTP